MGYRLPRGKATVLTRPSLALFAVLLIAFACAPESRTPPLTPVAQATSSPSHEPSPSPSSIAAPLAITAASFHAGEIGFAYAPARATAAGGVAPYAWSVSSGALPAGLSMRASGGGARTAAPLTTARFHVFPHIAFPQSNAACTGAQARAGCSTSLTYTLGTPGLLTPQLKSTPNPLPKGWSAVASKGTVTLTVPPPVSTVPGQVTSTLILVLVDGSTCAAGAGAYCSSAPATVKITLTC